MAARHDRGDVGDFKWSGLGMYPHLGTVEMGGETWHVVSTEMGADVQEISWALTPYGYRRLVGKTWARLEIVNAEGEHGTVYVDPDEHPIIIRRP